MEREIRNGVVVLHLKHMAEILINGSKRKSGNETAIAAKSAEYKEQRSTTNW